MIPSKRRLIVLLCQHVNSGAAGGNKKITISNTDNFQITTLVNSASTAPLIGLPPKGAKFCHTSNRLLVGH
jgi:hypothetical protein